VGGTGLGGEIEVAVLKDEEMDTDVDVAAWEAS
jgi:hypothetical protein